MSKRNNNFRRVEQSYEPYKKDKNHSKSNSFYAKQSKDDHHNITSKQVESRIQYINFKQQSELNINRLDLIFQKQPKEIQDKLMKLLISYNAVLQYNKNTDLFEVDLLLPFLNEEEKKQFIRQFLQIRKNKANVKLDENSNDKNAIEDTKQNKKEASSSKNNNTSQSKEIRKFSFNNNIKFSNQFEEEIEHKEEEMIDQLNYEEQKIDQEKQKIVFLPEQYNRFKSQHQNQDKKPLNNIQNQGLDLKKIEESISQRLKNAISIINRKKGKEEKDKQNESNSKSIFINEEEIKKEDSIIDKFTDNQFNDSQKISEKNSNYIKEDIGQTQQPSQEHLFGRNNFDQYNFPNNYQSETHKYREIIEQQQEEQDYEPLFKKDNRQTNKNQKVTSFEDYTKKYTTLKQDKNKNKLKSNHKISSKIKQDNQVVVPKNYFSSKEKAQNKKSEKALEIKTEKKIQEKTPTKSHLTQSKQRIRSRQSSSHSRSISTHKQSPSKESIQIKQNLDDFFNQHKQNLQSLYSEVRSKIKRQGQSKPISEKSHSEREKAPQKSFSEDQYILVLDGLEQEQSQNTSTAQIPNSQQFKTQMIKQYKKQILINSNNLSSQDLIRYFRFLHANAKKLYVKYLMNKQR